jgi:hypothetical protein
MILSISNEQLVFSNTLILNAVILNVVKNLLKADQGNSVYSALPARRSFATLKMTLLWCSRLPLCLLLLLCLLSPSAQTTALYIAGYKNVTRNVGGRRGRMSSGRVYCVRCLRVTKM